MKMFFSLVWAMTLSQLKTRYRKTWIGLVWVLLNPLISYGAQALVFSRILRVDVNHYPLFLMTGLIPWIFLTQSLDMTTSILVAQGPLIKSFPIDPRILILSQLLDNAVNFGVVFLALFCANAAFFPTQSIAVAFLPLCVLVLLAGAAGICWITATLQVFFRDARFIVSFLLSVGFFLTPIFYPVEFVPAHLRWISDFNFLYRLIVPFRYAFYEFSYEKLLETLGFAALLSTGLLLIAQIFWTRVKNRIYLYV